jgi:hypothetical protein
VVTPWWTQLDRVQYKGNEALRVVGFFP